ncbi:MAG: nucleotide pyrophosphohydrolase [Thermofilum sp. ex4484_82]|nr:MAG: nucleotide pyrophosphohydrolase [Thermofilum sp. ex4484_82]OYT36488.1 MAG: nucleotide pyrophosphohydrolase [Archaeoglobales archaeon ex4484_92]
MDLRKLARYQREFDRRHGWDWSNLRDHEKIEALNYLAVALAGEIGEFCNLVKKITRRFKSLGELPSEKELDSLYEELVDIFIYVLKASEELFKKDLGKEYLEKMKKNEERFKEFENKSYD